MGHLHPVFVSSTEYFETGYRANHPLGIPRISTVHKIAEAMGWFSERNYVDSPVAGFETLCRLHDPAYVSAVREVGETGTTSHDILQRFNIGNMENPGFKGVFGRASTSVGGSICAAEKSLTHDVAYHPAGGTHHGRRDRASGFCYFNDPAFAILTYLDAGLTRVLYVDLDAHHGDGMQDMFEADARIRTISIHEENRWPWTGGVDDRGQGFATNLPVPPGFNDSELAWLMDHVVLPPVRSFAPEAVVITTGADALAGDPLSKLALSNVALWGAVEQLVGLGVPTTVLGGGGYNPWTVGRCWAGLWARLSGQDIPDDPGPNVAQILADLDCDLVDEDDIEPHWLTTIADQPRPGPVRPAVLGLAVDMPMAGLG